MKCNKWTLALAAAGVVSLGSVVQAEEAQHQVLTALSSTTLSGYVDTSAIWKPGTDHGGTLLPGRVFDGGDKTDGFNLHAVKLTLEKPLDEGQWAAGYKSDLVFGPDANYYGGSVLNGGGTAGSEDFALKQAYVALRAPVGNGLDFKMGVFDTIVGYEVFESGNNPNFSRSYGFALEPRNHTGLLATYHAADWLSVAGGVADTSFGPINGRNAKGSLGEPLESAKTYMGSVTITMPEALGPLAGSVLYAGIVSGTPFSSTEDATSIYVGGTVKTPLEGLSVGAAWDYRDDGPAFNAVPTGTPPIGNYEAKAYSVAGYLTYAFTEKFRANARVDYLNTDARTFGYATTETVELLASTLTLDYSLWDNVITRAEVRWDHSLNGEHPYGGASLDDREKNAVTIAANVIYKF